MPFIIPFGKKTGRTAIRSTDANDLVDALNILLNLTVVRGNVNAFTVADGNAVLTLRTLPDDAGGGGTGTGIPIRGEIQSVDDDFVTVKLWSGTVFTGTDIAVAKPVELRHSASDTIYGTGVSYSYSDENTRTASAGGFDTENHKVVLPYEAGREILVMDTGLATGVVDGSSNPITYIDLNIGGRTWASVPAIPIP